MSDSSKQCGHAHVLLQAARAFKGKFLLILDYDGTLSPIVQNPEDAILSEEQHQILDYLASNTMVEIWIVSGRDRIFLSAQFRSLRIGLVAEHGAFWRYPGQQSWTDATSTLDFAWVSEVEGIFKAICQVIPETRLERKAAAVVWHWRANQEEGSVMAPAVQSVIQRRACRQGWKVKATSGKCIVEVRPESITKGGVVQQILQADPSNTEILPTCIICAGDDATDEGQ